MTVRVEPAVVLAPEHEPAEQRRTDEKRLSSKPGTQGYPDRRIVAQLATASQMLVSVVVRSFKRPRELNQLVSALQTQRYPRFEIIIIEQSEDPALVAGLESLEDPRIRVVVSPPLDPPAARNAGIRHARGDLILLMDDDDLPIGDDWMDRHVRNYDDPDCMGVIGRWVKDPERITAPRFPRLVRLLALRFTFWKDTVGLAHNSLRKEGVSIFLGSNASFRRSLLARIGGWDEGIYMGEEQSFAFKFARDRRPGEKLVFDPSAAMWRRTDIPGGLDRRAGDGWFLRDLEARLFYYRHVVAYYFPSRYRFLAPLFWLRGIEQSLAWVWDPDNGHRTFAARVSASIQLLLRFPRALRSRRLSPSRVRRVPKWD